MRRRPTIPREIPARPPGWLPGRNWPSCWASILRRSSNIASQTQPSMPSSLPKWEDCPLADRLRAVTREVLRRDPAQLLCRSQMEPDPWQATVLRDTDQRPLLLCCSRQAGKSTTAAALALRAALLSPPALVLLLSPTLRQSGELFRDKVLRLYHALGQPSLPARLTATELELSNGSRIVSLPESEQNIRGFSKVALLVIDEAARVSDDLYRAVRPMLAVSGGRLVALSTPFGRRGWFHETWDRGGDHWLRVRVRATDCPRIPAEFLEAERIALGSQWFRQEYDCEFLAAGAFLFRREWFPILEAAPVELARVRFWDL